MRLRSLNLHKYRMLHIIFFWLSPFFFVLHHIHSFSYLSWGVNNIPALFLYSLCRTHVQNTNSFLWAQYCACCLLPQVEVVKFPEIIMILHAAILARGLSFFFFFFFFFFLTLQAAPTFVAHTSTRNTRL